MIAVMAPVGVWELVCCAGVLLAAAAGGAALWLVLRRKAAGEPRCGQCDYSVRGLTTMTCPECGSDLREVGIVGGGRVKSTPRQRNGNT